MGSARRWSPRISRASTDMRLPPDRKRPPSAPIAMARTRSSTRKMRSRPSSNSTCHRLAASATTRSPRNSSRASTAQQLPRATGRRRCAPIATASTPSSRIWIRLLPSMRRIWPRSPARAVTKACGCHRNLEWKAAARLPISPAITDWPLALDRRWLPTAPAANGVHNILPSSDPRSTINKANLAKTCGQCHPGVTEKFTAAKVHVGAPLSADVGSKAVRWIRRFYLGMIFAVIGGMLLHNFIIWRSKVIARRKAQQQFVTRMPLRFRLQHATLLTSFFVLVVTGFALKFPGSWFADMLAMGERMRGILHRIAAVVLIAVSIYHIFDSAVSRDGRRLVRDLFPNLDDARGAFQNLCYYLGLSNRKPEFARFNYAEKAEYWALVWGMFVMAGTGLMLWAKIVVGNHLPRWWLDAATAIHFYEAILATLAILVWHFYQVFFDPDVYPMNWAWWDGKMTLHHYRDEHGLDSQALSEVTLRETADSDDSELAETKHGH